MNSVLIFLFHSSKLPSTQTITSPMHGSNATRQQQSLKRNIPLSFGGYSGATGEFQDLIDMNEFPEELPKNSNTPKNQTHIKNMASYNSNNNEIGLLPTLRPGSLIPASGIETLEKKLEKLNTELLGDREGQKSLFTKLEQVRSEKESLIKEMEKMRLGYEKRIDGLKEELADINKLRLELDYKDQQNLSQKAFFESELSRLEDEKAEIERNSLMKPERDFPSSHALEQDLWKARYQGLLSEMSVLEQEKKGFSRKIEEMKEESRRKEESNSLMVQNYEGKLANLAQELFRNKPEGDLVRKLKEENEMMLKELTETKLKLFRLEVLIPENSHLESSLSSLRQEYSQLQDQIVLLEKELEGKIQDLDLRNQQTISFYETKLRSFEDLQRDFLLVNSENERLINLLHEQEKGKEDFIEKKEIQEEIDGIMRKFLRERELFESLLEEEREFGRGKEELIKEKEEIIKEKEEIIKEKEDRIRVLEGERFFIKEKEDRIKLLEEEIGILRENNERIRVLEGERFFMKEKNDRYRLLEEERALITENNDIKRHSDGKISHNNEKTERKEFLEEGSLTNEKNDKIKDLQVIIMLISSENDRLFGIIEELEHETEFIKRNTSYNEENKKLLLENKDLKESLAINSNNNVNVKEENRRLNYENHEIKQRLNETPNSQNNLNIIEENRKLNVNFSEENRRLNFEIQELKKRLNESYNSQNNRNIIDENKRLNFENQDLKQRLHEASNINLNFSDENKRLLIENEDLKQKLHEPLNSPDLFEENRRLVIENQDLKYKLHDIVNSQTNTYENRRFGLENQEFKHRINEQAMYKSNSELKILKDKENYHILNNDIVIFFNKYN